MIQVNNNFQPNSAKNNTKLNTNFRKLSFGMIDRSSFVDKGSSLLDKPSARMGAEAAVGTGLGIIGAFRGKGLFKSVPKWIFITTGIGELGYAASKGWDKISGTADKLQGMVKNPAPQQQPDLLAQMQATRRF